MMPRGGRDDEVRPQHVSTGFKMFYFYRRDISCLPRESLRYVALNLSCIRESAQLRLTEKQWVERISAGNYLCHLNQVEQTHRHQQVNITVAVVVDDDYITEFTF